MVRIRVFANGDLFGRSEGPASFVVTDFYGGLTAFAFLVMAILMVARGGRARGHDRGRNGDVTERDHPANSPETNMNGDNQEVSLEIDSSEGDGSSDETGVNSSSVNRKPRSHSNGIYGKPPPADKRRAIKVGAGHIMDSEASRTVLSIVRQHWPVGSFTYRQADLATKGEFPETILKEFRIYYKYGDGITERQGDKDVLTHVKNRMRSIKCDAKKRASKLATRNGKPLIDQQPEYLSKEVWTSMCNHFLGADHASKSMINKSNRMKKKMVHATGATSHAKIKMVIFTPFIDLYGFIVLYMLYIKIVWFWLW